MDFSSITNLNQLPKIHKVKFSGKMDIKECLCCP